MPSPQKRHERPKELTPEQRAAAQAEIKRSAKLLLTKMARGAGGAVVEHAASPEGEPVKQFLVSIDNETGGLLGRAIRGIINGA